VASSKVRGVLLILSTTSPLNSRISLDMLMLSDAVIMWLDVKLSCKHGRE
jgi:hypothetical protein